MVKNKTEWNSSLAFLLAMIGSAIGLGNIWRFPYILYSNGGGSFIIPYIVALAVVGFSFLLLEYSIGYTFKNSLYNIYKKIKPKFEIIAWFVLVLVFLVTTYYVCIVGWDLIYFFLSFTKAWGSNPNIFFSNTLLQSTDSLSGIFNIVPLVLISSLVVWFFMWFISHKDLNDGIGKFSKIALPLLFVLVCIIVFFSISLPGAATGISTMFTPDWSQLTNYNIWIAAFGQIIFSLSLGMGITIAYTSYLPRGANLTKNSIIVLLSNSGFEVFNAVGVFSILGFMSLNSGISIDKLIVDGTGLAFIAFPQVFNVMGPYAYILGPIFFLCIFIAGITSAIALLEPITSSISSKFGFSRKKSTTIICVLGLLVTIMFTTSSGSFILGVFDKFLNNFGLLFEIILEAIIFTWIYNVDELIKSLNENSLFTVGNWWKYVIKYVLPVILTIVWLTSMISSLSNNGPVEVGIEILLGIILIIVPIILYKLPSRDV